ncbi:hypothetical protein PTTW11_08959 [Pyrenophora teres f. teres]|uniref:Uncharacterized protein n=1 Tax=Pyrenophora teres f. teres TaxID=97479 RepID=A0A6S6W9L2_9PLEO|nr:hypothetical protein PTTW11_08959 [Pyrenophora teres f. teres]
MRNERQVHLPSPVKHRIIWSSSLKGMERPVQSFKSFIRTTPSRPGAGNDKPLPPTPFGPSLPPLSLPTLPEPQERSPNDTSWEAPIEWGSPSQLSPSDSMFAVRTYSPLISEPSPGLSSMQTESDTWPFETNTSEQPRLYSIQEGSMDRPRTPPRHPRRPSPFHTPTTGSDPGFPTWRQNQSDFLAVPSPDLRATNSFPNSSTELRLQTTEASPTNFTYRMSNASTKAKAYASLGIGSPRNTKAEWENWPDASHDDSGAPTIQSLRGQKLPPLDTGLVIDDDLDEPDSSTLSEQMQLLSFSQDYHNVLADQYLESHAHLAGGPVGSPSKIAALTGTDIPTTKRLANEYELLPEPLAWKKELDHAASHSVPVMLPSSMSSTAESRSKHNRLASWASLRHLNNNGKIKSAEEDDTPRSSSDFAGPCRKHIDGNKKVGPLRRDRQMPDIITHARTLRLKKRRARDVDVQSKKRAPLKSRGTASTSTSPPPEQRSPLIRLPGGFALVRQSPSITSQQEVSNVDDVSPLEEDIHHDQNIGSPVSVSASDVPWRRSSWYSQHSHAFAASTTTTTTINRESHSSFGSPQSRPKSNPSFAPTSPLAHGTTLPPTSPRSHATKPPLTSSPFPSYGPRKSIPQADTNADAITEEDSLGRGIMNKARDVRDAWRRHQREVKHDKLKQSIRVLGPTDPTAAATEYVKHERGRLGGEGRGEGRRPGYMV